MVWAGAGPIALASEGAAAILGIAVAVAPATPGFAQPQRPPVFGQCAVARDNPPAAIPACTAIIQSGRASPRDLMITYVNRGIAFAEQANHERALADLNHALRIDPNHAGAYNARGLILLRKGQPDQAITDFDRAIRLNPQLASAYNNRALAQRRKRNLDRALAEPSDLRPGIFQPGADLAGQGDVERAIADLTRGLKLNPGHANAYVHRGQLHERKSQRDAAMADFRAALSIEPGQPAALAGLARMALPPVASRPALVAPPPQALAIHPGAGSAVRPLAEALGACTQAHGAATAAIEIVSGKRTIVRPAAYRGRRHLDCMVRAIAEEAAAIHRDYRGIIEGN